MKIYSQDKSELMDVSAIECRDNALVIKGKIFGAMPMSAIVSPEQARQGLKLLNVKLVLFLLTFLFRSSGSEGK